MAQTDTDLQSAVHLCAGVLPVWVRHLALSRTQSEAAVHAMLQAFSEMDPGLRQAQQPIEARKAVRNTRGAGSELAQSLQLLLLPHLKEPDKSAEVIGKILGLMGDISHHADHLDDSSSSPSSESEQLADTPVDRMYKGLQYQDRIGQMMALLEQDMLRMQKAIVDPQASKTGVADWLTRLESQYVMAEQRTNPSGEASGSGAAASDETTFF